MVAASMACDKEILLATWCLGWCTQYHCPFHRVNKVKDRYSWDRREGFINQQMKGTQCDASSSTHHVTPFLVIDEMNEMGLSTYEQHPTRIDSVLSTNGGQFIMNDAN